MNVMQLVRMMNMFKLNSMVDIDTVDGLLMMTIIFVIIDTVDGLLMIDIFVIIDTVDGLLMIDIDDDYIYCQLSRYRFI